MVVLLIAVVIGTWVPLYAITMMRQNYSAEPKIHYVLDMDIQPSYGPQEPHSMFADGRASRLPPDGTVARGHLRLDDHYYLGYRQIEGPDSPAPSIEFFATLPKQVEINEQFLEHGHTRYSIYCSICHADDGLGKGLVHQAAVAAKEDKWVPPTNLMTQEIRDRADGQIYQSIVDGVRNMPGYKTQIGVNDRWAIVAYLRKLQRTSPVAPPENPQTQSP